MLTLSISQITTRNWPFERDVDHFSRLGVVALGVLKGKLEEYGVERGARLIRDSGLRASCYQPGDRFAVDDPALWPERFDILKRSLETARLLGAGCLVLLTGPAGQLSYEDASERFLEQLAELLPTARDEAVPIALESHVSLRIDVSFVHRLDDVLELVDAMNSPHFGACCEVTHVFPERGFYQNLRERASRLFHVQTGDFRPGMVATSERAPLGDGAIDFPRIFQALDEGEYDRYLELELLGSEIEALGYEEAIRRSLAYLERIRAGRWGL
jgi:sugar phosphate isomerase/epimerase